MLTIISLISIIGIQQILSSCTSYSNTEPTTDPKKRVFRLLAVERQSGDGYPCGQNLIGELLAFPNWNNETGFTAYIHYLTDADDFRYEECYMGKATSANIWHEIRTFLGAAGPDENVVLYIHGHGSGAYAAGISFLDLYKWLQSALPNTTLSIIISSCYSGACINDGERSMLGPRLIMTSVASDEISGHDFDDGLAFLGSADDINKDNWVSMVEAFQSARMHVLAIRSDQHPKILNGLPEQYDPPFVLLRIAITSTELSKTIVGQGLNITLNVNMTNFGDSREQVDLRVYTGGLLLLKQEIILSSNNSTTTKLIWKATLPVGNYTIDIVVIRLDIFLTIGSMIVAMKGDLNLDNKVNIIDIAMIAKAFDSCPGKERWDPNSDMNEDCRIDEADIAMIINEFGKRAESTLFSM